MQRAESVILRGNSSHLTQRSFLIPSNSSMRLQIHGNIWINLVIPKVIFLHEWIIKAVLIVSSGGGARMEEVMSSHDASRRDRREKENIALSYSMARRLTISTDSPLIWNETVVLLAVSWREFFLRFGDDDDPPTTPPSLASIVP